MSSYALQLHRAHVERRNRLHPVARPARPVLKVVDNFDPASVVWPAADMVEVRRTPPTIREVQDAVSQYYGLPLHDMLGPRRSWDVTRPRQTAMYLAKVLTGRAFSEIGRRFNRDHTTIMSALRVVDIRIQESAQLREEIEAIKALLWVKP